MRTMYRRGERQWRCNAPAAKWWKVVRRKRVLSRRRGFRVLCGDALDFKAESHFLIEEQVDIQVDARR